MARSKVNITEILRFDTPKVTESTLYTSFDATDGIEADLRGVNDRKFIFSVKSSNATTDEILTIVGGNHETQSGNDITMTVPTNGQIVFVLNTAKFKNVFGPDAGKVIFKGSANLSMAVVRTP